LAIKENLKLFEIQDIVAEYLIESSLNEFSKIFAANMNIEKYFKNNIIVQGSQ
jgi:hypothetical protein